ncbi:MAG TPA: VanZ family protein [Hyphomonadaceae bacterium]|jgi:VanZ family protein|nr:VanZ family protein [Hyphomonadaceae bacterium]
MTEHPKLALTPERIALAWALIALVMMLVIVWAAMQVNDPLSAFVHTDKMRHILALGALGLCAAFMPTTKWRILGLATVLTFAMAVEIIQIPIPDRTASLSDLLASVIGSFGGFGLGAAATTVLELVRPSAQPQPSPSQRD